MSPQRPSWDTSLALRSSRSASYPVALPTPAGGESSPALKIHSQLRGRYLWALLLAILCGVAGGFWGYQQRKPLFQSAGLVRIQPVLPRILYQTDQTGIMPMYEQFFNTQLRMMQSSRVIALAAEQPEWKSLGRGTGEWVQAEMIRGLEVTNPGGTELIQVNFSDVTPTGALAGVRSILQAYIDVYHEQEEAQESQRLHVLNQRRDMLQRQVQALNDRVMAIANKYGTDELESIHEFKMSRVEHLETLLEETKWKLTIAQTELSKDKSDDSTRRLTLDDIAKTDVQLQEMLKKQWDLEHLVETMAINRKPDHPGVILVQKQLDTVNAAIKDYVDEYMVAQPTDAVQVPGEGVGELTVVTLSQLQDRERLLRERYEPAEAAAIKLGQDNLEMRKFRTEAAEVEQRLAETRTRIEQLSVEAAVAGRVQIVSTGEAPAEPSRDPRTKWAIMGSAAGGSLGFGIVVLLAILDRRLRGLEQVRTGVHQLPILGILPQLPGTIADPAEASIAAHCVHQLRARLQIEHDQPHPQVIAVTSPSAGDGKTSLATALALSFAGAKVKTLLMDMDVVGGGLSNRLEPFFRPRLGEILYRRGIVGAAQLEESLKMSHEAGRLLGACLVERAFASEEDVVDALNEQAKPQPGLIEVLGGRSLDASLSVSRVPHLSLLQLGAASPEDAGHLSSSFVRRILDKARRRFDVVIVDTGPIPGSLEASMVIPQADSVVLVVSRGSDGSLTTTAVSHLDSLKAVRAGVVFNRAKIRDVHTYSQPSRRGRIRRSNTQPMMAVDNRDETSTLGPLASAVACTIGSPLPVNERETGGGSDPSLHDTAVMDAPKTNAGFVSIWCSHCGAKLAVQARAETFVTQCPKCKGRIEVDPPAAAVVTAEIVRCDKCGRQYGASRRSDGSPASRCPHCRHRMPRPSDDR